MAKIDITDTIHFGLDEVYPVFRDGLASLVPYLPTVESIEVESFERVDTDTVKIVNVWTASDNEIPKIAQKFIRREMLKWTDRATWHDESRSCDWDMEVGFLTDAISCFGTTTYKTIDAGRYTQVRISGELRVDGSKIPGVPNILGSKVGSAIEAFVVKMIAPNLKESNRGCEKYLSRLVGGSTEGP